MHSRIFQLSKCADTEKNSPYRYEQDSMIYADYVQNCDFDAAVAWLERGYRNVLEITRNDDGITLKVINVHDIRKAAIERTLVLITDALKKATDMIAKDDFNENEMGDLAFKTWRLHNHTEGDGGFYIDIDGWVYALDSWLYATAKPGDTFHIVGAFDYHI